MALVRKSKLLTYGSPVPVEYWLSPERTEFFFNPSDAGVIAANTDPGPAGAMSSDDETTFARADQYGINEDYISLNPLPPGQWPLTPYETTFQARQDEAWSGPPLVSDIYSPAAYITVTVFGTVRTSRDPGAGGGLAVSLHWSTEGDGVDRTLGSGPLPLSSPGAWHHVSYTNDVFVGATGGGIGKLADRASTVQASFAGGGVGDELTPPTFAGGQAVDEVAYLAVLFEWWEESPGLPPLRQFPRDDHLATASARRLWPTSSQQATNRRLGYY